MIIKILLIAAAGAFFLLLVRERSQNHLQLVRRLGGGAVALSGSCAVIWPDAVTWLAHRVGVSRGTDLVLYVAVMVFLMALTSLYHRVRTLEEQVVLLNRELALRDPVPPVSRAA